MWRRLPIPILLALPGLALAWSGLGHPHFLTPESSDMWWHVHVPGLLLFPLVGVALVTLVRRRNDPVAWIVRIAAYLYMTVYTALDVIDGISAGYLTHETGQTDSRDRLFALGHDYEHYGSWALITACLAVAVDQLVRHGWRGVPVLALVPGAWLVHTDHIFSPHGVEGMVLIGLATGYAAWNVPETRWTLTATSRGVTAS